MKSLEKLLDVSSTPGGLQVFEEVFKHVRAEILSSQSTISRLPDAPERIEIENAFKGLDLFLAEIVQYVENAHLAMKSGESGAFNPRQTLLPLQAMFDFKASQKDISFEITVDDNVPETIEGSEALFRNTLSLFLSYFFHQSGPGGILACLVSASPEEAIACYFRLSEGTPLEVDSRLAGRIELAGCILSFLLHSVVLASGSELRIQEDFSACELTIPLQIGAHECACRSGLDACQAAHEQHTISGTSSAETHDPTEAVEAEPLAGSENVFPYDLFPDLSSRFSGGVAAVTNEFVTESTEGSTSEGSNGGAAIEETCISRVRQTAPASDKEAQSEESEEAIPGAVLAPHPSSRDPEEEAQPRNSIPRVLIADDNILIQRHLSRWIENNGFEASSVSNGKELLTRLENETFDVCLIDCRISGVDAYKAAGLIRTNEARGKPHVFIVGLATHVDVDTEERCLNAGMDAYLSKPVHKERLMEILRSCGRKP